jgi:hypothetical protein
MHRQDFGTGWSHDRPLDDQIGGGRGGLLAACVTARMHICWQLSKLLPRPINAAHTQPALPFLTKPIPAAI